MKIRSSLACLLACALIWTSPGFAAYAAVGEVATPMGASAAKSVPALTLPSISMPSAASLTVPVADLQLGAIPVAPAASAAQAASAAAVPAEAVAAPTAARQALSTGTQELKNARGEDQSRSVLGRLFEGSPAQAQDVEAVGASGSLLASSLTPSDSLRSERAGNRPPAPPSSPKSPAPQGPRGSKFVGFLTTIVRVALAGAAVVGLQRLAVLALPAVFGLSPVAAVWAVSSGALLLPAALFSRYLLSKHDSLRLRKPKWVLDLSIGALLGACAIALPAFMAAHSLGFAAPLLAVAGLGSALSTVSGGKLLDYTLTGGALLALPGVLHVAGAGALGLAPILGMMALPVMTTISFFLGSIVKSAESGEPFSVPGTLQKMRFPSFTWVMTGVVFALMSGFAPYHPNIAFGIWTVLGFVSKGGSKSLLGKLFNPNVLFLGMLAVAAATGFTHPVTFLALAFAPERAAAWTEALLGKFLPKGAPAPSTAAKTENDATVWAQRAERRTPNFHHWLKTGILIGTMVAMGFGMGAAIFGVRSLVINLAIGALMSAIPYFLSDKLVVAMMKAKPTDQAHDPEFFGIMNDLRGRINEKLAAKGRKPIPMPSMVNVPMDAPNAFATGRDPYHAVVGVTQGIKYMLLDPENLRQELVTLMTSVDPSGKSYRVFRRAIAGSVAGVTEGSTPQEISQALMRASPRQLKALGVRLLRGVLGHEFSHVMDRHMLTGSIAGALSTGIAFASYGAMWGVAHGRNVLVRLKQAVLGRSRSGAPSADNAKDLGGPGRDLNGVKPEFVDPATAAALVGIAKLSTLLWAPVIVQITQMAGSRNNEAQADEDGAYLTGDPEALALSLGLLMTWRPKQGFLFNFNRLPGLAATAHMFTVNPLQQLQQAGAMPKADAASQWVLGKRDNWMLDLFITHPDTRWRIETLNDISEAMGHARRPPTPPSPPPGRGGNLSPPLAMATPPAGPAPTAGRGGLFPAQEVSGFDFLTFHEKSKSQSLTPFSFFRVLPDPERNREFWKFTWGQALLTLGLNFHYAALPGLVAPNKSDTGKLGVNRSVNWSSQAVSSLLTGPIVDRESIRKTIFWTHLGRGLVMLAVPLLFFHGYLLFGTFLLVMGLHGFVQSTSITAGSVAFNRILGRDDAYYNRANAVFNIIMNAVGVVAPLLAGAFIGHFDARLGLLAGNALAYAVYGAALLGVSVFYGLYLRVPRDEAQQAQRELADSLKDREGVKGVRVKRQGPKVVLQVDVGESFSGEGIPPRYGGFPVVVTPAATPWKELSQGFRLLWRDRFLRRYQLISTLGSIIADSLVFTALPRYIHDVLSAARLAPSGLFSQAGAFGLYLAAAALGLGLSSLAMMALQPKAPARLSAVAAEFGRVLAAGGSFSEDQVQDALEAVRHAPEIVLDRYVKLWREDPEARLSLARFQADVRAQAETGLDNALFGAKPEPGRAAALMTSSGLDGALDAWAARHFGRLRACAQRQARSGLDDLQRQGRWSAWLQGAGYLAYLGVFLQHGLLVSVGFMLAAMLLQGPAQIVWASLVQRVLGEDMPGDMGKVYSSIYFYDLLCSVVGVLIFGALFATLPTTTALLALCGAAAATGVIGFLQPRLVFPRR